MPTKAKLTCKYRGEFLCKMELRDIHKNECRNICKVQLLIMQFSIFITARDATLGIASSKIYSLL